MNHGSSDRVPASSLIFFASVLYTLTSFFTFKALWEIDLPVWSLLVVLGLQFATLFLGGSKVLTQLGAASLSALLGVAASIGAIFLIFPPVLELQIAGSVGGGAALVFVIASFVAASRADPVSPSVPEPLVLGEVEEDPAAELIKYGEVRGPEDGDIQDLPLSDAGWEEEVPDHKIEELSQDAAEDSQPMPEPDQPGELVIPDEWVEETARSMAYDMSEDGTGEADVTSLDDESKPGEKPVTASGIPGYGLRTRYKVLDAVSGEHFGTYYGDEGYSTLDPVSLTGLLGSKLTAGELRIVKLDWSNFDEIEVHVSVEEVVPIDLDADPGSEYGESGKPPAEDSGKGVEAAPDQVTAVPEDVPAGKEMSSRSVSPGSFSSNRYVIYDRRTIQPMGEYVPEGERSRVDRLMLYKMFPEYDFKTFEIDSIRWEDDEVRIFVRGEKKKGSKGTLRSRRGETQDKEDPDGNDKPRQRELLDES